MNYGSKSTEPCCRGYTYKHMDCTDSSMPTYISVVTMIPVCAWLHIDTNGNWLDFRKDGDLD